MSFQRWGWYGIGAVLAIHLAIIGKAFSAGQADASQMTVLHGKIRFAVQTGTDSRTL
jgi:hypothetical protein